MTARWPGAPKQCPAVNQGHRCNRDANHPGSLHRSRSGFSWTDSRGKEEETMAYMQFCDFRWQDRFSQSDTVCMSTFDHASQILFTTGPTGVIRIPLQHTADVARRLRRWADSIEKEGKFYSE
jgi:hypothetical protein